MSISVAIPNEIDAESGANHAALVLGVKAVQTAAFKV